MPKPFFYRIDAAEFVAAVLQIPDGQHKQWVTQLALDMVSGTGTMDFSKKIIEEVENYRKKQAEAGAKGGKPKHKRPYSDPIAEESDPIAPPKQNLGNSSSSTETKEAKEQCAPSDARMSDFEEFWEAFKLKKGRGGAEQSWKKIKGYSMALKETIIEAAEIEASNRPQLIANGGKPKWAQGWITERRWEDEREPEAWRQNY